MSITSFTASSLYSGVNSRRCLPMMNILSYEVSTARGQSHADQRQVDWQFTTNDTRIKLRHLYPAH